MQSILLKLRQPILSLLYLLDCIFYVVVLLSLFIFISLLSSNANNSDIQYFDIIIYVITGFQIIRPILMLIIKESILFLKDFAFSFIFVSLYFLFIYVGNIHQYANIPLIFKIHIIIQIIFLLIYIVMSFTRVSKFFRSIRMDFLYSFTFGFIFLIFFGTWLLSLPFCRNIDISITNLLFTSTSAVTITGLSVFDIAHDLTYIGQTIIMLLVQIGGLGIMTFSTLYFVSLNNRISFEERMYTVELFAVKNIRDISTLLKWIFISTICIELFGATLIYIGSFDYLNVSNTYRIFFSIFHAVMGYCNGGFSLVSSGLRYFFDAPMILYTIGFLTILGGIGFATQLEVSKKIFSYISAKKKQDDTDSFKMGKQSKLILILTTILVVMGSILFYYFNSMAIMQNFTLGEKISNSFFQSTAIRTSGFQTISTINLENPTLWFFILFMFIGTAPNSTGGGLKITTFFVLVWGALKIMFHRTHSQKSFLGFNFGSFLVAKAGIILLMRISILCFGIFLISCFEPSSRPIFPLIFECVSAISTTGLSMDITPTLTSKSKYLLIVLMFIGRVGSFYILSNILPLREKKSTLKRKQQNISLE